MTQENPIYSSDLAGVVVGETAISDVQGDTGVLSYRGIDINDLVDAPYLHVVWMVLFGEWPNEQQRKHLVSFMCRHTRLTHSEIDLLQRVSRDLHPMLMLQGLVPLLDLPQEETLGAGLDAEHGLFLAAKIAALTAAQPRNPTIARTIGFAAPNLQLPNPLSVQPINNPMAMISRESSGTGTCTTWCARRSRWP